MDPSPLLDRYLVRRAGVEDVAVLARHRCEMFKDMGRLRDEYYDQLIQESRRYFAAALTAGDYVAWLVAPRDLPEQVVAGGGMQLRPIPPGPDDFGVPRRPGPQGLVVNVYTEQEWRGRGLATLVMQTIVDWSRENGVVSLVLHASQMGRPIYEKLGFIASNEMVYPTQLLRTGNS